MFWKEYCHLLNSVETQTQRNTPTNLVLVQDWLVKINIFSCYSIRDNNCSVALFMISCKDIKTIREQKLQRRNTAPNDKTALQPALLYLRFNNFWNSLWFGSIIHTGTESNQWQHLEDMKPKKDQVTWIQDLGHQYKMEIAANVNQ